MPVACKELVGRHRVAINAIYRDETMLYQCSQFDENSIKIVPITCITKVNDTTPLCLTIFVSPLYYFIFSLRLR